MDIPQEESAVNPTPKKNGDSIGPVVGIVIIIIVIVLGGVYYFTTGVEDAQERVETPVGDEAALMNQGDSTELSAIEADVQATDLSGLDAASANFESELESQ